MLAARARALSVLLLCGGAGFVVPQKAQACSCSSPAVQAPTADSVGVPINTALWDAPEVAVELTREDGVTPVEIRCRQLGIQQKCLPRRPLAPDTRYRVNGRFFTTGPDAATATPAPPSEEERRYYASSGWFRDGCSREGPKGTVVLTLQGGPILVVDTSDAAEPGPPLEINAVAHVTALPRSNEVWIGEGACLHNRPTQPGDRFPLRAGVLDLAGNFSGWVELEEARIPQRPVGCAQVRASTPLVLVVLALWCRRRAR